MHYTELHRWTMCWFSEHSRVPAVCREGCSTEWRGRLESIPEVHSVCHLPGFETGQYWEILMVQWNLLKHYQNMCQPHRMGYGQCLNLKWIWMDGCARWSVTTYTLARDHFVYVPSQWETMLQCNVVSHWLGACTKWSLCSLSKRVSYIVRAEEVYNLCDADSMSSLKGKCFHFD